MQISFVAPSRARRRRLVRFFALSPPAFATLLALVALLASAVRPTAASPPLKRAGLLGASEAGFIEVTVRICPPGYDVDAAGADPEEDCVLADDGIRFTLRDDDPATDDRRAETGEQRTGVVVFDNVPADQFVLSQRVPDGVGRVLVLSCEGFNTGPFYRMPLHEGADLNIPAPRNAPIRCVWLNVLAPGATPLASPGATPRATPGGAG